MVRFWTKYDFWIEWDGVWMLDVLVACKWMLCKFYLNGWYMENPVYDHNGYFGLNV